MKVKKTIVKKYAEGVSSTSTPAPKKMNFVKKFINKQREKEQAFQDYSDAEDAQSFKDAGVTRPSAIEKIEPKSSLSTPVSTKSVAVVKPVATTKAKASTTIAGYENDPNFVGPKNKTNVSNSLGSDKYSTEEQKPIGWNDEGEKEMVMAYQKRHGLKVDGVWGKQTEKYYQDSLKAKSAPKKMAIKKTTTIPSTDGLKASEELKQKAADRLGVDRTTGQSKTIATGKKDANGNVVFSNGRLMTKDGKMTNASTKKMNIVSTDKSGRPKGTVTGTEGTDIYKGDLRDALANKKLNSHSYKNEDVQMDDWSKEYHRISDIASIGKRPSGNSYPHVKGEPMDKSASKTTITKSTPKETQKKTKVTYDSTRGGMPWNHYKTVGESSGKKTEEESSYFNSIPNLDYSKFPKAKKK